MRVCRPGGRIGLACWTPQGFLGQLFQVVAAHVPPMPGVRSPLLWGTDAHIQDLFAGAASDRAHAASSLRSAIESRGALGRRVSHLLRPGAQGVRGARRPERQAALEQRPARAAPAQPTGAGRPAWSCRPSTWRP